MRRALVCLLALALAPQASAAAPTVTARASAPLGSVPCRVTLRAEGDASAYEWDLGDGSRAQGAVVTHTYTRPGIYRAVVTALSADGEPATAELTISALRLTLRAPAVVDYGERIRLRGRVSPVLVGAPVTVLRDGARVGRAVTRSGGRFAISVRATAPGAYTARHGAVSSAAEPVRMRPVLETRLPDSSVVGAPLRLAARVRPAGAGRLRIRVWRSGRLTYSARRRGPARIALSTHHAATYRVRVALVPAAGFLGAHRTLRASVLEPWLSLGSRGPSVLALERHLAQLRFALPRVDASYGLDTYEAVLAFQKVYGLPWTGRVDARVWRTLGRAHRPSPRYGGDHIEISKGRQYLLIVRRGRVESVVHVSTGATGNTPIGRWHVYRKVPGWDWVLWYPMYFLSGFAIHGYPSVPAYPASHGCVRVPMWIAPRLFAASSYGQTVYVYW